MSYLSQATHLNRETLYRTLSKDGNPRLDTLHKILNDLGNTQFRHDNTHYGQGK